MIFMLFGNNNRLYDENCCKMTTQKNYVTLPSLTNNF